MGNRLADPDDSHVLRVWHANKAYIAHNEISGSSINSSAGRQALKLHGPSEEELVGSTSAIDVNARLATRTRYVVVSDNLFGSSGPWPVSIGPQNSSADERLKDIVLEKNRFFSSYGTLSSSLVQVSLNVAAQYVTLRNNIFDGEGSSRYYAAINIKHEGIESPPLGVRIFNNTVYKTDDTDGAMYEEYSAFNVDAAAKGTIIRNNLVQFSTGMAIREIISGSATDVIQDHNLLTDNAGLVDPDNSDLLQKNFGLSQSSQAHDAGIRVSVFEDFAGNIRPLDSAYDLGVFEQSNITFCGNDIVEGGEQCDGASGVGEHQACSTSCTIVELPYCGDGVVNSSEACDGAAGVGVHQACSASCTLIDLPYCGDGIVSNSEACDGTAGIGENQACNESCVIVQLQPEDTLAPTVTVASQTTNDTSPALSGSVDGTGSSISSVEVIVAGSSYFATLNGASWSIAKDTISPPLAAGSYNIIVNATDSANNTGQDTTNNELLIVTGTSVLVPELASRVTGVAPLGVFFDAVDKVGVMQPPAVDGHREFADLHYQWDFGDAESGIWAISGKSKNSASGYASAHVYEKPGMYTANLTITDMDGVTANYKMEIEVQHPDTVFAGNSTICFSTGTDFTGCPTGANEVTTNILADIQNHVAADRRILLRRGDSWTTADSISLGTTGPLIVGAFGECQNPDQRGICANAPLINSNSTENLHTFDLGYANDTRVMDLHMVDLETQYSAMGGGYEMNQLLLFRIKAEGFNTPLGNGHWETEGHDQVMLVENDASQGRDNIVYVGSKRLVLMGNRFADALASHVVRVWHARKTYIAHNEMSGSSISSTTGRHALKLHGPSEDELVGVVSDIVPQARLGTRTRYVIISDNLFGSSGPMPVAIGPQDDIHDQRLEDIILEKNRFFAGYGTLSRLAQGGVNIWARYVTVRNNLFSGEGSERYYTPITITQRGIEPPPLGVRVFNNTIYKTDDTRGEKYETYTAVHVGTTAQGTIIQNNLVQFSTGMAIREFVNSDATGVVQDHNLLTEYAGFIDPDNPDFLQKDFSLSQSSQAIDVGTLVPVFEYFSGNLRPLAGSYNLGAFEQANAFNSFTNTTFSNSICTNLPIETPVGIFASPTGISSATGTIDDPLDLATALASTSIVQQGETLWLMEGTYRGSFTSNLRGTSLLPISVKPLPGKRAIIDGNNLSGSSALSIKGEWTNYYGLEVMSSSTTHVSSETGSNPTDLVTNSGVTVTGPNTKVINFIVHDNVGSGMNSWSNAPDSELYGNIIYNNGWTGPDRGHGHAIYAQNNTGTKKLTNNIIFFGYGTGIHVYTEGGQMNNFDVQHNTWFMTGASDPRASQKKDNCLIGGFQPVNNLTLKNNLGYSENSRGTRLGYGGNVTSQDAVLADNYLNENFWVAGEWTSLDISNTSVFRGLTGSASSFIANGASGNIVQSTPPGIGNKVFVKANDHDPRRARIVIYNHDDAATVDVDLNTVLKTGEAYRIHSSFALFEAPMTEGVYDGSPVSIPMGTIAPPQPTGSNDVTDEDYPHKKFGVFIVTHGGC